MIGNKPAFSELIQWSWDYVVMSYDAINYIETYTFKSNGVYSTGVYSGGVTVGYIYVKYDDVSKTNFVSAYGKQA